MVSFDPNLARQNSLGIDRVKLRLLVLGILVVVAFVALFSRLWFLQVLASDEFRLLAKENRVRKVESEPPRGRILDRNGKVLVENRKSLSVTIDKQVLKGPWQERKVLNRLSELLKVPVKDLENELHQTTVSPYKPVAVANDVEEWQVSGILENQEDYPGVGYELLPIRKYLNGQLAAQILGYVNEISDEDLKGEFAKGARPPYRAGDIVGRDGIERTYDRMLRGRPRVERVIVNSTGNVIDTDVVADQVEGRDLILTLDARIQKIAERALANGIEAARASYEAPAGGAVVMDPTNGDVLAMASFPTFDPSLLADGITEKEFDALGNSTPDDPDDDVMLNRTIQITHPTGSTFKLGTAIAAIASGVATPSTYLDCPPVRTYGNIAFNNWSSSSFGTIGFAKSLEISCNTFYYELGWRMELAYGAALGDGSELFQKYLRQAGLGRETGIDLPNEADGRIPDEEWCLEQKEATEHYAEDGDPITLPTCNDGWLPGFSVNMSIGQGDVTLSALQMAVMYGAIANGGDVVQPRLGMALGRPDEAGEEQILREFQPKVLRQLPIDESAMAVLRQGLEDVVTGSSGTARGAFSGFPLDKYPIAGKTGTGQIGETDKNYAWFISYGPTVSPKYVIAVYVERAGHGGESAAPIARQIYEGIFGIDKSTEDVQLGSDASG